jgi:hypothetical protein
MGLLDDAIREHLELKRKHGASEEEIAQEEAEALGPARRDFPMPPAATAPLAEMEVTDVPAADAPADEHGEPEPPPFDPLGEEALAPESDEPAIEHDTPRPTPDTEPPTPEDAQDEPTPAPFEDAPAAEEGEEEPPPASESEDVLEDTPEFLQDAPEHDRLWFEQKPPRDFDFE